MLLLVGDTHQNLSLLLEQCQKIKPKALISLGDTELGLGEHNLLDGTFKFEFPVYLLRGNHEDHILFSQYEGHAVVPNLYLIPQCYPFQLEGLTFAGIGGNYSPKYYERSFLENKTGKYYYKNYQLESLYCYKIDVVLSHEAPFGIIERDKSYLGRAEISQVIHRVKPRLSLFGHHHKYYQGEIGKTKVYGIAQDTIYQLKEDFTIEEIWRESATVGLSREERSLVLHNQKEERST